MGGMEANVAARRWYCPTPAWLVWGAVVATGLLLASERWRWFFLGQHKGYAVLAAVAVVGAVLVLIPAWMLAGLLFRRRAQFGLRTLLVLVALCACVQLAGGQDQAGAAAGGGGGGNLTEGRSAVFL